MSSRTVTRLAWAAACAAGLAVLASPSQAAPRNPADSFLPVASSGVAGMIRQIEVRPTVRRHYANYFRVPEARVADYLRHNLVATRLTRPGRYTMYLVRPNGLIYPVMMSLPKGARVFTLQTRPVALLTGRDGNPLKEFKPQTMTVYVPAPPSDATVRVSPSKEEQTLTPVRVQETILPTIVVTPVYRPASPLSASERAPEAPPAATP